ncbi:MAG: F0F1 ATP synthase subunit delta [Acidithiobacillus sp.]
MADLITIARPYADALFSVAKAEHQESAWSKALSVLSAWIADPQARAFLDDPERAEEDKIQFLSSLPVEVNGEAWRRFIAVLLENDRWAAASEIAAHFQAAVLADQRWMEVVVRSAVPLADDQKSAVREALRRRFPDHEVQLREEVDEDILGGLVLQAGDLTIDASVRGQLEQLTQTLRN